MPLPPYRRLWLSQTVSITPEIGPFYWMPRSALRSERGLKWEAKQALCPSRGRRDGSFQAVQVAKPKARRCCTIAAALSPRVAQKAGAIRFRLDDRRREIGPGPNRTEGPQNTASQCLREGPDGRQGRPATRAAPCGRERPHARASNPHAPDRGLPRRSATTLQAAHLQTDPMRAAADGIAGSLLRR